MTKDKKGDFIFKKGGVYTPKAMFSPLWKPGVKATCLDTAPFTWGDGIEERVIPDGKGLFTIGDDTRWYVASDQFEESN